ncbi:threonine/serine exporter family protein [Texcoconibacillus texcoconensis]|uniref:Uncharacterized membrane protein YjjP (DUF1212 family) n=1 Tax=Texcoconibacillus texcoconensis TaxID=1095777 RepID=A0A840QUD5_9BACI|nr:threonine/serine exporter family protein [Texcoconibacillus texcoconensis]MBB5174891.1 uncharacterized membrane protein YjjP (DUF1212 family) [Texcoconibacillus texcoconensis]
MAKANQVMDICLLAGEIMLTYGAETYRVEDTLERMAKSANFSNVHCFATATGIFLSFEAEGKDDQMQMVRIDDRLQDLNKVAEVNQISREFVTGYISADEAQSQLQKVSVAPIHYPLWFIHLSAAVAGSIFSYLFGGSLADLLPVFFTALIASMTMVQIEKYLKVRFFAEFTASFLGGFSAIILYTLGLGLNVDQMIIGTVMPLVPGVTLTNALRDLMSGDLIAGTSRGAEALLTSLAIASGIALALTLTL